MSPHLTSLPMRRLFALLALVIVLPVRAQTTSQRAVFSSSCTHLVCVVDASASTSPGNIAGYIWAWGDGRVDTARAPKSSHTYAVAGKNTVRLTLLRTLASNTVTKVITIAALPVPAPAPTPVPPPAAADSGIALPRATVGTAMPVMTGSVIRVAAGASLQNALNTASPGDVIELANGATFIGNFTFPQKAGPSWIIIRPADTTRLPTPGQRMTPAIAAAANLPKIISPTNLGALSTVNGSHHWRLIGVEITASAYNTGLVRLGEIATTQNSLSQVPHDFILDRVYIHGAPSLGARRCVSLNSAASAVIDSWLSSCVDKGSDSQAIWGANGPGPYLIENNYLEGAGESIMFGGADPAIPNLVPSDITIRRNHVFKPLTWKGVWTVKNLFEIKNAQRVLVEGNIFDGNWTDAQTGTAINLKVSNQSGGCTWCTSQDVTFRYNIIRNVGSGFVLAASDPGITVHAQRVSVSHNLVYNVNVGSYTGDGRGFMVSGDPTDFTVAHNTIIGTTNSAFWLSIIGTPRPIRFTVRDNIISGGAYGVKGDGLAMGSATITQLASMFTGNVIILPSASGYPGGNNYPASVAAVGLAPDYSLLASSPYVGKGADIATLLTLTRGVVVP
jgi:PKD repeat protein